MPSEEEVWMNQRKSDIFNQCMGTDEDIGSKGANKIIDRRVIDCALKRTQVTKHY